MHAEYRTLLERSAGDPEVRVIVVTGSGRGFCAGADAAALEGEAERGAYDPALGDESPCPVMASAPNSTRDFAYHFGIPKPIIAAVNGPAAGVGLVLACFCDLRFAARGAKLTTAHGRLGLPAEFGLSWLLPRLIGVTRAADLLFSSRIVLAEEAETLGLVNRALPPEELLAHTYEYAAPPGSPRSRRRRSAVTKLQLYRDLHRDAASSVHEAGRYLSEMMGGADFAEGVGGAHAEAASVLRRPRAMRRLGIRGGARACAAQPSTPVGELDRVPAQEGHGLAEGEPIGHAGHVGHRGTDGLVAPGHTSARRPSR